MKQENHLSKLTCVLGAMGLLTVVGVNLYIASLSGYVVVEKEVHFGTEEVVSGVRLREQSYLGYQHLWDTSYSLANPSDVNMDYGYSFQETDPRYYYPYRNISLHRRLEVYDNYDSFQCTLNHDTGGVSFTYEDSASLALHGVANTVAEGEDITKVVHFGDYYDYYPYELSNHFFFEEKHSFYTLSHESKERFYDNIKAPVHPDHQLQVRVWDKELFPDFGYECNLTAFDVGVEVLPSSSSVVTEEDIYLLVGWHIAELPEGTTSADDGERSYEVYVEPVLYHIPYEWKAIGEGVIDYLGYNTIVELGDFQVVAEYKGLQGTLYDLGEYIGVHHPEKLELYHKEHLTLDHSIPLTEVYFDVMYLGNSILLVGGEQETGYYYQLLQEGETVLQGEIADSSAHNEHYFWSGNYFYEEGKLFHQMWLSSEVHSESPFEGLLLNVYDKEGLAYSASYLNSQGNDKNENPIYRLEMPKLLWE